MSQLIEKCRSVQLKYDNDSEWWSTLRAKSSLNKQFNAVILYNAIVTYHVLCFDAKLRSNFKFSWIIFNEMLNSYITENYHFLKSMAKDISTPLNYFAVLNLVHQMTPKGEFLKKNKHKQISKLFELFIVLDRR